MVGVITNGAIVSLVRDLVPLSAHVTHAGLPLVSQTGVTIGIPQKLLLVVGPGDELALELDLGRGLLLLGLEKVVDLGPGVGRHRKVGILVHGIQEGVRLLIPDIVIRKKVLSHVGIAEDIDFGARAEGGIVELGRSVRIRPVPPLHDRGVVAVGKPVAATRWGGVGGPLLGALINLIAAVVDVPAA